MKWDVSGVAPSVRRSAEEAARRAGIPLGDWLSDKILASTRSPPAPTRRAPPPRRAARSLRATAAGLALGVVILGGSLWGLLYILEADEDTLAPRGALLAPEPERAAATGPSDLRLTALRAAASSDAAAQVDLAQLYLDGNGVAADPARAARLFEDAALQGHVEAQYRLAVLYEEGRGRDKDATLALFWYDSAATRGSVAAALRLAAVYAEGRIVPRDYVRAASWYRRAADAGDSRAQFALGYLHDNGLGVARDGDEARRWWTRAAASGSAEAVARLDGRAAPAPFAVNATSDAPSITPPATAAAAVPADAAPLDAAAIAEIQRLLALLAFNPGASDGRLTDATRAAIREYQGMAGLAPDGEPSAALLASLKAVAGAGAPR